MAHGWLNFVFEFRVKYFMQMQLSKELQTAKVFGSTQSKEFSTVHLLILTKFSKRIL